MCSLQLEHCTGRERFEESRETGTQPQPQVLVPEEMGRALARVPAGTGAGKGSVEVKERLRYPWSLRPRTPFSVYGKTCITNTVDKNYSTNIGATIPNN